MADGEDFLFQSAVEYQNKPHILTLNKFQLAWEATNKPRSFDNEASDCLLCYDACVDLHEVVGVKAIKIPPKSSTPNLRKAYKVDDHNARVCIEMQPILPLGFTIFVINRAHGHKWRYKQISFQCKDGNLCQQWRTAVKDALKAPGFYRPQKLVVFVNPFSGKKKAQKVYNDKVEPLFDLADINVRLIETERQNHARDLVQELDLSDVDGLVCVGGDGMFSEVLNGLLARTAQENHIEQTGNFEPVPPDIRIGIIPAGSTNTIVYTTTGVSDVITSTLHIILGDKVGIDVNSVNVNGQFIRYNVTMLGYGYMGDLLKDSDNNRWMGPRRYSWSGTKSFLANNAYYGEIKYRLSANSDSHPTDEVKCYSGCSTCLQAKQDEDMCTDSMVDFRLGGADTPDSEHSCGTSFSDSSGSDWRTEVGKFVAINSVTMSCSCDLSPPGMSPYCHLGDGCMDLILVSECSRIDFLKFLMRTAKGEERHKLDFIQMHRVKEFTFRPLTEDSDLVSIASTESIPHATREKLRRQTSKTSVWNCDGEVIFQPKISVRVHCQLVKLFARGVEDLTLTEDERCKTCCEPSFTSSVRL